ncbi:MAG: molybdopterin-dependent oxidoreductase [Acidobacteriota bacterium]
MSDDSFIPDETSRTANPDELESIEVVPGPAEPEPAGDSDVEQRLRSLSRRGFIVTAAATAAGVAGWKWLMHQPLEDGVQRPFRRVLKLNEKLSEGYFRGQRLNPTYALSAAAPVPRVNGHIGLDQNADHSNWRLRLEGTASGTPVELTLDDIRKLPRRDLVTEFRCIEGWTMIVHWTGARLSDLVERFPPATRSGRRPDLENHPDDLVRYVAMETPGRQYYVGLDMESALHPQTLLTYAINDRPLSWDHGAPVRLTIPVKYGVKNIKRIATIRYTDVRPPDFWARQGYDWYAGH